MKDKYNKTLAIIAILLLFIGVYILFFGTFKAYLIIRLVNVIIFALFFFIFKYSTHKLQTLLMCLLVLFEVFVLNIENSSYLLPITITNSLTYLVALILIYKKVNLKGSNPITISIFTAIASLNLYLIYLLITAVDTSIFTPQLQIITTIGATFLVLVAVAAANYNFKNFSSKSTYFLLFIFTIGFADITSFTGYFLNLDIVYFFERFLTAIALYTFLLYCKTPEIDNDNDLINFNQ